MKKIYTIIDGILKREGGFVDHPHDRGGPTCHGVTEATARRHGYTGRMEDLPLETAREILLSEYYRDPHFDVVEEHSARIAGELADTGVLMGTHTAAVFLQRSLNAFNKNGELYEDLVIDGDIGGATILALSSYLQDRSGTGEHVLLTAMNSLQGERMVAITEKDHRQEDFAFGWFLNRVVL